jgi:cyclophilin family peptidyl-prolyl cis-trans isomerase
MRLFFLALFLLLPIVGQASEQRLVEFETSKGTFVLALDAHKAPHTVTNFLSYVQSGFYQGTIFHRVIEVFMIQGGGLTKDMQPKATNAPIKNEGKNGLKNKKYTVAMARTNNPHSATSQFFINTKDNDFLDTKGSTWGYAVFGKVYRGADVVDAIEEVVTTTRAGQHDVPAKPVVILNARIVE